MAPRFLRARTPLPCEHACRARAGRMQGGAGCVQGGAGRVQGGCRAGRAQGAPTGHPHPPLAPGSGLRAQGYTRYTLRFSSGFGFRASGFGLASGFRLPAQA
jgi:hypothetical protein